MTKRLSCTLLWSLWLCACGNAAASLPVDLTEPDDFAGIVPETADSDPRRPAPDDPESLKVAFASDTIIGDTTMAVLQLIRSEGAHLWIQAGDVDNEEADDPAALEDQVDRVLGRDFPHFAVPGNHDQGEDIWLGAGNLQERFLARLDRIAGAACTYATDRRDYGILSACTYRGLFFVLVAPDIYGAGHAEFIRSQLAASTARWRICVWHKVQRAMQVGAKQDSVGWPVYEACRAGGALIVTGHEHSYVRTRTLSDIENQVVDSAYPTRDLLRLGPGFSAVLVTATGGRTIRNQQRCLPALYPYGCQGEWAKLYTSDSPAAEGGAAKNGALFCSFPVGSATDRAHCAFKTIDGAEIDTFAIETTF